MFLHTTTVTVLPGFRLQLSFNRKQYKGSSACSLRCALCPDAGRYIHRSNWVEAMSTIVNTHEAKTHLSSSRVTTATP